jgi:hypothetical protein
MSQPPAVPPPDVPPEVALAALLRTVQRHLDDVAHDLPAGRATIEQREELATGLEALAKLVRVVPAVIKDEPHS